MNTQKSRKCQQLQQRDQTWSPKVVPSFSSRACQKNVVLAVPGKPAAKSKRVSNVTLFEVNYNRAGFPLAAVYGGGVTKDSRQRFRWLVPARSVDYDEYLPILIDGLRERPAPFKICAALALWDMLAQDEDGQRVLDALPKIVFPLRRVLKVGPNDWTCVVRALKTIQMLAKAGNDGRVGRGLVRFYRQLLPSINAYRNNTDAISTDGLGTYNKYNVAELCDETLATLEKSGGPCAYANIKYMIPTYATRVSCCPPEEAENGLTGRFIKITHYDDFTGQANNTDIKS